MSKNDKHLLTGGITRREMLKLLGSTSAAAALSALPGASLADAENMPERPNIVFILGDNHRFDAMGCAGHPFIQTPGLDRLAQEGVVFDNAFNTTSLCSPSRASILTGVHASTHGVKNNHTPWTGKTPTFLQHLSQAGYATSFIGKWHMPGEGLPELPFLDLFVSYTHREGQGAYFDCPLIVNGEPEPSRTSYITAEMTDRTLEFIEKTRQGPSPQPFCVYLSHRSAHPPYQSPPGIAGMYDDIDPQMPRAVDPYWFGKVNGNVFQGVMMGSYIQQYRRYCETITAMDRDIERLLTRLDEMGLADNTVVIYLGDNGMQWGEHGCHGIREPYEESIRLPFIVRCPWLVPVSKTRRKQMALNIDIAPTLLDLARLPIPQNMEGQSLLPYLRDASQSGRDQFLLEFWRYFPENTPTYFGVRTRKHKYVEFERGRDPWLFDLRNDPHEKHNLFGKEEGKRLAERLKFELINLKKK